MWNTDTLGQFKELLNAHIFILFWAYSSEIIKFRIHIILMNYKSYGSEHKNWVIMEDIADVR